MILRGFGCGNLGMIGLSSARISLVWGYRREGY